MFIDVDFMLGGNINSGRYSLDMRWMLTASIFWDQQLVQVLVGVYIILSALAALTYSKDGQKTQLA